MTITTALQLSPEEMQEMNLAELAELHNLLTSSKQKKARLQADIVAGVITAKKKEAKQEQKQEEQAELVENSTKLKRPKASKTSSKPKATAKPKAEPKAEEKEEQGEPKADKKPKQDVKKPKSLKRPKKEVPNLKGMSKEELEQLASQLIEKSETFPKAIEGEKLVYDRIEVESVEDIQKLLIENPMNLYMFVDEKLGDDKLTQFVTLFANAEALVIMDTNRQRYSTVTIKMSQLDAEHITFDKAGKFEYAFYLRKEKVKEEKAG